jgi:hypothetical protein
LPVPKWNATKKLGQHGLAELTEREKLAPWIHETETSTETREAANRRRSTLKWTRSGKISKWQIASGNEDRSGLRERKITTSFGTPQEHSREHEELQIWGLADLKQAANFNEEWNQHHSQSAKSKQQT